MSQQFTPEEIARKREAIRRFLDRGKREPEDDDREPPAETEQQD